VIIGLVLLTDREVTCFAVSSSSFSAGREAMLICQGAEEKRCFDTGAYPLYVRMVFRYDGAERAHGLSFFRSLFLHCSLYFAVPAQLQAADAVYRKG
jgi:hypothetical protein